MLDCFASDEISLCLTKTISLIQLGLSLLAINISLKIQEEKQVELSNGNAAEVKCL